VIRRGNEVINQEANVKPLKAIAALLLILSLLACGEPVHPEKSAYVGEWKSR
jgi:hypothetical protein